MVGQAWRLHENGTLLRLVDATVNIRGCEEEVERVLYIALTCVQSMGHSRPSMARVVSMLKGEIEPELVSRQSQFNRPKYDSFLAAAQSSTTTNDFTGLTAIAEHGDDDKPLLTPPVVQAPPSNTTSSTLSPRSSHSGSMELTSIRPR